MTAGRCWLIQWHPDQVHNSIVSCKTHVSPALGRHLAEVAPGDRAVMWMTGSESGVWALGVISSEVYEKLHRRNYGDPGGGEGLRPTVNVRLTHLLDLDPIDRETLKADDPFADYPLFEGGRARGTNPRLLSEEQWLAILERTPAWSAVDRPSTDYRVTVDLLASAADEDAAGAALLDAIRERRYDELSFEAERLDQSDADWEYVDLPAATLTGEPGDAVITWETAVPATTAYRAFLHVFRELRRNAAGRLAQGKLSVGRPPALPLNRVSP